MLCSACENFRFPPTLNGKAITNAASTTSLPTVSVVGVSSDSATAADIISDAETVVTRTNDHSAESSNAPNEVICQQNAKKLVIDELLTYTIFYRDKCTAADLHKILIHFYLPTEISTSKRTRV